MEQWIDIIGYNGDYQVSNYGRVKSFKRYKEGRIIKQFIGKSGYYKLCLSKNSIRKNHETHLLVWDNFGLSIRNGLELQVDHVDNNKSNNHIDNLQILTGRENTSKHHNLKTNRSSKYIGVHWYDKNKKWISSIGMNGYRKYLGSFDNEYDAHLAYQEKLNSIK